MNYDVRLRLDYVYDAPVAGGRHLVRVTPANLPGRQRVVATTLTFLPVPAERGSGKDFFGNSVDTVVYRETHDRFEVLMTARVSVDRGQGVVDVSPGLPELWREIAGIRTLDPHSPHHFLGASTRVTPDPAITAFAREAAGADASVFGHVAALCNAIHDEFAYDAAATEVDTAPADAFRLRRGVCQDFAHVMITGLRGLGIPAGYVSGYLRTLPPPGQARLEGADAMHAWVSAYCGGGLGWVEFDPTNRIMTGPDHITVGYGRDYADVAPIVGVLRAAGGHQATQAVDVVALEQA